jgi:peroxiredoxin family protein
MLNPAPLMMAGMAGASGADANAQLVPRENRCTILIIKSDFESLMAAMMCATTAAAQGMETSIFFSFWGVNVLRGERPRVNAKQEKVSVLQKMMQWMMPRGPARQKMSKMHMGGMGKGMMQFFMRRNNVLSLEQLMNTAAEQDVKFIVCAMSMGIMGIQKRDIVDLPNIEFAGVATYIELSRRSAMTMVF